MVASSVAKSGGSQQVKQRTRRATSAETGSSEIEAADPRTDCPPVAEREGTPIIRSAEPISPKGGASGSGARTRETSENAGFQYDMVPFYTERTSTEIVISGILTNTGRSTLVFDSHGDDRVQLSAQLYPLTGDYAFINLDRGPHVLEVRGDLEKPLLPIGESSHFAISVQGSVLPAGRYLVVVDLLIEHLFRFADLGQVPLRLIFDHNPTPLADQNIGAALSELMKPQLTYALVRSSPVFDAAWYTDNYPDIARAGEDPVEHYLKHGAAEGRDPAPNFSTLAYLADHPNAVIAGINPLVHHLLYGAPAERDRLATEKADLEERLIKVAVELDRQRAVNAVGAAGEMRLKDTEMRLRDCLVALELEENLRLELEMLLAESEAALARATNFRMQAEARLESRGTLGGKTNSNIDVETPPEALMLRADAAPVLGGASSVEQSLGVPHTKP